MNPIESPFAMVRHLTRQTKGYRSRLATWMRVFKLARLAPWFGPFFREEVQATAKIWKKSREIRQTPDDLDAERQRLWKIKAKHDKEEQAKAAAANQKESP
jgi:hypothetical protein